MEERFTLDGGRLEARVKWSEKAGKQLVFLKTPGKRDTIIMSPDVLEELFTRTRGAHRGLGADIDRSDT